MGRSRANFQSAEEDTTHRLRRKKNAGTGETSVASPAGQDINEGKRALYHCNYCNKDITGRIRIKCVMCPDFDLCIECFTVGAELTPHKSSHPYRVMDNLSFPLICPDWNADEEILLLEGMEMYGMGNWAEVAEHVGTKSKELCIEHYTNVYLNSLHFPLPDLSHVIGKNRKELLAMAKGHCDEKKGSSMLCEHTLKEISPFSSSRVKYNNLSPNDPQFDRSSEAQKPVVPANEDQSLVKLSGYNPKRHEFDPEYDNDAEQLLSEMEFKDTDTEDERELKLRVMHIYSKRLDERKRRKDFIIERNLLYPNPLEEDFSPDEKALSHRYDVFMRFHSKEEHEEFLQAVVTEYRTRKRIEELNEAHAAGCRTSAEADKYLLQKKKLEAEERESYQKVKDGGQVGETNVGSLNGFVTSHFVVKDEKTIPSEQCFTGCLNGFNMMESYEAQFLSESEKVLCHEVKLAPSLYLKMQEVMTREIFIGNVTKKSEAHLLFRVETGKVDIVYDMLVKKGIARP